MVRRAPHNIQAGAGSPLTRCPVSLYEVGMTNLKAYKHDFFLKEFNFYSVYESIHLAKTENGVIWA